MLDHDIIKRGLAASILCRESYNDNFDHNILGYDCRHPLIENEETQCHIISTEEETTIVFPGTAGVEDVCLDFSIAYDPQVKDFGIHSGVNKGLNSIWDKICDALTLPEYANRKIHVYGHSLGGGFAAEAARRLNNVGSVHTFGAFKLYDKRGYVAYPCHDRHFTWVNGPDLVARFPLRRFREKHLGTVLYLTKYNKLIENVSGFKFWRDYFSSPVIRANVHRINNYIKRIQGIL